MATYTLKGYSRFPLNLLAGSITALNGTATVIKCALVSGSYSFDQETHDSYSDISAYEITDDATLDPDGDYTAGGVSLTNVVVSMTSRVTKFDSDDPTWDAVTIGAYGCVFYDDTPVSSSNKKLICYCNFGDLKASNSGTYKIVLSTSGLFTITVPV